LSTEKETFTRVDLVYRCLADEVRTSALKSAIVSTVKPGDVVADLGTGTGVLALFAALAGAKKVYAIEISPILVRYLQKIVNSNNLDNIVEVIQADAKTVNLPQRLDVLIIEMLTTGLIDEDQVAVLNNMWNRNLVDSQTKFVPCRCTTFAELVETSFDFFGVNVPTIRHEYPWLANPQISPLTKRILLDSAHFRRLVDPAVDIILHFIADSDGTANAIRLTSVAHLTPDIRLSNTCFLNAPIVIPIKAFDVRKGQRTQVALSYVMGQGFEPLSVKVNQDLSYAKAHSMVHSFMKHLVKDIESDMDHSPSVEVSRQQLDLRKLEPNRFVIGLDTSGCSFAINGGCNHCGQLIKRIRKPDTLGKFKQDFRNYSYTNAPEFFICTNGSWFDDTELDLKSRDTILQYVLESGSIKKLTIETRPEFVDSQGINQLRRLIEAGINVTVGLGFDSLSEEVREICLNKTIQVEAYIRACEDLRANDISVCSYVLLKPPFLLEKESIDEAVRTTLFAFDIGSTYVFLEPLAIQEYTLQAALYQKGLYRPPWFWSVLEVIRNTYGLGELKVGGQFFIPRPYEIAHNCPNCDTIFHNAFLDFNKGNSEKAYDKLMKIRCSCYDKWEEELIEIQNNLPKRVFSCMSKLHELPL